MRVKRLEDILEECIDAGVEGRRTVEQSLSLYPADAAELEPLLRAALQISDQFQAYAPAPTLQQRGLHRFLAAANDRRRVRQLTSSIERRGWLAGLFRNSALGGLAAAAAVVVVTVAVAGGILLSGGSDNDGGPQVASPGSTDSSSALAVLRTKVDSTKDKALIGGITTKDVDLAEMRRLIEQLTAEIENGTAPVDAQQTVDEIRILLTQIVNANPELADDPVVMETEVSYRELAGLLPGGNGTPAAVTQPATPTAPPATEPPTLAPTQAPTDPPTAAPTAQPNPTEPPAPTETADARELQGFNN
jgi:hypothetical protein